MQFSKGDYVRIMCVEGFSMTGFMMGDLYHGAGYPANIKGKMPQGSPVWLIWRSNPTNEAPVMQDIFGVVYPDKIIAIEQLPRPSAELQHMIPEVGVDY